MSLNLLDLDKVKNFFKDDRYAVFTGIEIVSVSPGQAECHLKIKNFHLNAGDTVQGGVTFTLADFAFAVAANGEDICENTGKVTVSLSNNITYLRPPKGSILTARAKCISRGKTTALYQVSVVDDLGTLVAEMTANGYIKSLK